MKKMANVEANAYFQTHPSDVVKSAAWAPMTKIIKRLPGGAVKVETIQQLNKPRALPGTPGKGCS
jgi:hypothetical protein